MKHQHKRSRAQDPPTVYDTRLEELFTEGPCEARILRLIRVLETATVGELLAWAAQKPRGLGQVTDYTNIGKKTLAVLVDTLEQAGVENLSEDQRRMDSIAL